MASKGKPNLLLIGIDSLVSTHMSGYGYHRLTTPHIDEFSLQGALFENTFCPHVPTTPGYGSMLTGLDCFGTDCVALRHKGQFPESAKSIAAILGENDYNTSCVGFTGNPAARGFQNYLNYGGWSAGADGRCHKAESLNGVALPELQRLVAEEKPFFLFLRHMDPHTPYLPPAPYDRMFYHGDECDPDNDSMQPVYDFAPFADYFKSWLPGEVTDKEFVIALYDGAVAYMDACIARIFTALESLGILDDTIVVINADHGETLYDHECWFDHHGIYDNTLKVPLIIRYPEKVPAGIAVTGYNQHKDLAPTLMELMEIDPGVPFDGESLMRLIDGEKEHLDTEFYVTECTWMRKHGWRTPQWKFFEALEPDLHFKPPVELYDLMHDPEELENIADREPRIVEMLRARMLAFIEKREAEVGRRAPIYTQECWHGHPEVGPAFTSSEQAYNTMHIGSAKQAAKLQDKETASAKDGDKDK